MKTYDDNDVKVELVFLTAMKLVLLSRRIKVRLEAAARSHHQKAQETYPILAVVW